MSSVSAWAVFVGACFTGMIGLVRVFRGQEDKPSKWRLRWMARGASWWCLFDFQREPQQN